MRFRRGKNGPDDFQAKLHQFLIRLKAGRAPVCGVGGDEKEVRSKSGVIAWGCDCPAILAKTRLFESTKNTVFLK